MSDVQQPKGCCFFTLLRAFRRRRRPGEKFDFLVYGGPAGFKTGFSDAATRPACKVFLLICIRNGQKQDAGEYKFSLGVIKLLFITELQAKACANCLRSAWNCLEFHDNFAVRGRKGANLYGHWLRNTGFRIQITH